MKWLKHFCDSRHNPKFRRIEKKLGEAGYARAWKLLEIVAERGGTGEKFSPRISLKRAHTDLEWLADELGIKPSDARKSLDLFASVSLIDQKQWRKRLIYIPQMGDYKDEWTRKKQRSNSGATPEKGRSESPQSKSQKSESNSETDTELESESDGNNGGRNPNREQSVPGESDPNSKTDPDEKGYPEWMNADPWVFLGIDRKRVPLRFKAESAGGSTLNFELLLKVMWGKYRLEARKNGLEADPLMFAERVLDKAEEREVEYPPCLLKVKKVLEAGGSVEVPNTWHPSVPH